jgi:hypothetical protein
MNVLASLAEETTRNGLPVDICVSSPVSFSSLLSFGYLKTGML